MKTYQVKLSKTYTATVQIQAATPEEAEEEASYRFERGIIELEDSGIPGDVDIEVRKIREEESE